MSYCPKCGNKVDESMAFCSRCGAPLKGVPSPAAAPQPYRRRDEKSEKGEKNEKQEKGEGREKQEKGEQGFIGYLIGGLILITLGLFSVLQLSGALPDSGQNWAIMLLVIGIIIIIGAVYVAVGARRRSPQPR